MVYWNSYYAIIKQLNDLSKKSNSNKCKNEDLGLKEEIDLDYLEIAELNVAEEKLKLFLNDCKSIFQLNNLDEVNEKVARREVSPK